MPVPAIPGDLYESELGDTSAPSERSSQPPIGKDGARELIRGPVRGRSKAKVTSREKTSVRAWESHNRDGETLNELEKKLLVRQQSIGGE